MRNIAYTYTHTSILSWSMSDIFVLCQRELSVPSLYQNTVVFGVPFTEQIISFAARGLPTVIGVASCLVLLHSNLSHVEKTQDQCEIPSIRIGKL